MNIQKLNEILDIRRKELIEMEVSYSFNKHTLTCFNKYLKYLKNNELEHNEENKNKFLIEMKSIINKKDFNYYKHAMDIIDDVNYVKNCKNVHRIIKYEKNNILSNYNNEILQKYFNSRNEYNKKRTVDEKKVLLKDLMIFCQNNNINDYSKLDIESVNKMKQFSLSFELYSQKKKFNWTLRDFLLFLYDEKYISINYSYLIDKLQVNIKKLPVTWSQDEIEKIVENLPDNTDIEIRNKAMCLLTIRLGIRFIDVKNLQFENIDWNNNIIEFNQVKTGNYLKLPLPEEVGSAIIRYIKEARPNSLEKYIFISHNETVSKLSDSFNIREYLFEAYIKAGINYLSKTNKGIHNFRHALATNMLKNDVPLDIISSILGHEGINSAKTYISLNDKLLEECCIDLEDFHE